MTDQAAALRQLMNKVRKDERPASGSTCQITAITSGKGGVGKSNITVNLGIALARTGAKVLVLDADIGTANIDILLNMDPRHHLGHVTEGKASIIQILEKLDDNLYLIPGASGVSGLAEMPADKLKRLRTDLDQIESMFDHVLVDTAAGVSPAVINLLLGADRILLVCSDEPTSIVDAYALCKVLYKENPDAFVELIANNVQGEAEAQDVYGKLRIAIKHFLEKELHFLSYVVHDEAIGQAVINQKPLLMTGASGGAVDSFTTLASKLAHPSDWSGGRGVHQLFSLLLES